MQDVREHKSCPRCIFPIFCVFLFIFGVVVGAFGEEWHIRRVWKQRKGEEVRVNDSSYTFINPLLECSVADDYIGSNEGRPSQDHLNEIIDRFKEKGDLSTAAVYFRNLNDGPWVGINQSEWFAPASLLKVPLMIVMLKAAEVDPNYLSQKIKLDSSADSAVKPYFQESGRMDSSKEYTYQELMEQMIIYSDNDAANTILKHVVTMDQVELLFKDLRIDETISDLGKGIDVKNYGMFFRVLFNASYLSKDSSEKALSLLSRSTFQKGIVAGIPSGTTVAHKFGERVIDDGTKQLHDCGIVYFPKEPYLLCIMTRGKDFERLADVISTISKQVYNDVAASTPH